MKEKEAFTTDETGRPYESIEEIKEEIDIQVNDIIKWIIGFTGKNFMEFEKPLRILVFGLGTLFINLFFYVREEKLKHSLRINTNTENRQGPNCRIFNTIFGKVRYWRTYIYKKNIKGGYYPLDIELGLPLDGFSMMVRSFATKIATKMSYAQTVTVLSLFLEWSPCQTTIEEMVIGLGKYTEEYFELAPAPKNDGEILIIQIDSKAVPTATDEELKKRCGKRANNPHKDSPRHRDRINRKGRDSKKRRKKGDKAKNGKMATIVVMYTLRKSEDGTLEGPINKKVYASFAPKRHAVAIARREADKRGFKTGNGKLIQLVTDGDNDLARYIEESFPKTYHTIDMFHVLEYLWEAGGIFYKEGSNDLAEWVYSQKKKLCAGKVSEIIEDLKKRLARLSKSGSGMAKRIELLTKVINYLEKRIEKMNYDDLLKQDLEIGSGAVEGAVKNVIAKRFDNGGMRWIKERAEMLLQLRCIEVNGDWDNFIEYVHEKTSTQAQETQHNFFLKSDKPPPLPTYGLAA